MAQHLLQNPSCAREYNDNKFFILVRGRTSFHLTTLEATYIKKITHYFPLLLLVAPFVNRDGAFFLFRQLCLNISHSLHVFHSISDGFS